MHEPKPRRPGSPTKRLPPRWFVSIAWARFRESGDDPDDFAWRRPGRTEVVVLEPASGR